ncbi:MAG: FAD-dependent oxidoreductase [marine bacterium B5-7]|nr:MAG: FAD-dependent oxidoreductase [marine bacterium B5-7]
MPIPTSPDGNPPGLWAAAAPDGPECGALERHRDQGAECDVIVIGAGFTGLSTALHLASRGVSVRVLESGSIGFGASGRNGGQVNPGWYITPDRIRTLYGSAKAERVLDAAGGACDRVFALIDQHEIACDAVRPGYIQAAPSAGGFKILNDKIRQWSALGAPVEYLGHDEMTELIGTRNYEAGMLDRRGGNLNPLAYARGLAAAAITAGAHIHTRSAVTSVRRSNNRWSVSAANVQLNCDQVVFATNAYTDNAWPGLRQAVIPVSSVIAATEPLADNIRHSILIHRHAVSETARVFYYYKLDGHGRFLIGCKGPAFSAPDHHPATRARAAALQLFPQLGNVAWEFSWGGYVAVTSDMRPRLMQLAPGVLTAMGYQGRGIAMATEMGYELSQHILDGDKRFPLTPLKRLPMHFAHRPAVFAKVLTARIMDRIKPS